VSASDSLLSDSFASGHPAGRGEEAAIIENPSKIAPGGTLLSFGNDLTPVLAPQFLRNPAKGLAFRHCVFSVSQQERQPPRD
jgi:hypothetical protein